MNKTVVELFAGVGGFRVGLNNVNFLNGKTIEGQTWKFVWFNQWEPSTKEQHAYKCYLHHFDDEYKNSNKDIMLVDKTKIPNHSLLVGGFPCQDYSVAQSLATSKGIEGKKGVLWWAINDILISKKPPFVLLENVDRLLKSPAKQRGRDFGIILKCFDMNGYDVEWRMINAGEYGHAQKRRRTYIFAYKRTTKFYKNLKNCSFNEFKKKYSAFISFECLDVSEASESDLRAEKFNNLNDMTKNYKFNFENSGWQHNGVIYTCKTIPKNKKFIPLSKIIENKSSNTELYLDEKQLKKFIYLKGKKYQVKEKNGFKYNYNEGAMPFPENLNIPGRTMLTSEGTVNRSSHAVKDSTGRIRFITPIECERLNEFPDNWTNTMPDKKRYFMMGNALVCGVISKIGKIIERIIEKE